MDIVLFDGICNLCSFSIDFIIRNERGNRLKFASLQSEIGNELTRDVEKLKQKDSIVFSKEGELYFESDAALLIVDYLKWYWRWLKIFWLMPHQMRDHLYRWVARNRYKWFGKKETCRIPTVQERNKFLG